MAPSSIRPEPLTPLTSTPWAISARNTSTLIATSTIVATGIVVAAAPSRRAGAGARVRERLPEHSGQRTPTAACVMQEVQIGRSQFEHEISVSRSGWR